jgi:hypothetical protein
MSCTCSGVKGRFWPTDLPLFRDDADEFSGYFFVPFFNLLNHTIRLQAGI